MIVTPSCAEVSIYEKNTSNIYILLHDMLRLRWLQKVPIFTISWSSNRLRVLNFPISSNSWPLPYRNNQRHHNSQSITSPNIVTPEVHIISDLFPPTNNHRKQQGWDFCTDTILPVPRTRRTKTQLLIARSPDIPAKKLVLARQTHKIYLAHMNSVELLKRRQWGRID